MGVDSDWPPRFTLDQNRILELLTGDRFYADPSAALREAVLNAIDASSRRRRRDPSAAPRIEIAFSRESLKVEVDDFGIGMSRDDVASLFSKVGASAAALDSKKESIGEFGIGVVSYFMAADSFDLQTFDGVNEPIGLRFDRAMLAGGTSTPLQAEKTTQGTKLTLHVRDSTTFELLLKKFSHWCRDVEGLRATSNEGELSQGGRERTGTQIDVPQRAWIERTHLGPVDRPTGWEAMTGKSTIDVLYRGVFVQQFEVSGAWGIQGSIDVDPKHFPPKLNREGFVGQQFQAEIESYLLDCHAPILQAMADVLAKSFANGELDRWTQSRWATLWLAVPRTPAFSRAAGAWDDVFRGLPAFEIAIGNAWQGISLDQIKNLEGELFLAPSSEEHQSEIVRAAVRLLRNSGRHVIRGIRKDRNWMRFSGATYGSTSDLIAQVFSAELPSMQRIASNPENLLSGLVSVTTLFAGPPAVELVRLGSESAPILKLSKRMVINVDHPKGMAIVHEILVENRGPTVLVTCTARHSPDHLAEVASFVRELPSRDSEPESLSPVRKRYIRSILE